MNNPAPQGAPRRPDRLFLFLLGLGLTAMLVTSVIYRLSGPPLVRHAAAPRATTPAPNALPDALPNALPDTIPPAMAEALQRQGMPNSGPAPSANAAASAMAGLAGDDTRQTATIALMQRIQANPGDVDALLELAELFRPDNPESARAFLNRAMVAAPADPRPPHYLGVLLADLGQPEEAAEAMRRSLTLGDSPATRYSLAILLRYHLNRSEEAGEHLRAALASPDLSPELRALVEAELDR